MRECARYLGRFCNASRRCLRGRRAPRDSSSTPPGSREPGGVEPHPGCISEETALADSRRVVLLVQSRKTTRANSVDFSRGSRLGKSTEDSDCWKFPGCRFSVRGRRVCRILAGRVRKTRMSRGGCVTWWNLPAVTREFPTRRALSANVQSGRGFLQRDDEWAAPPAHSKFGGLHTESSYGRDNQHSNHSQAHPP